MYRLVLRLDWQPREPPGHAVPGRAGGTGPAAGDGGSLARAVAPGAPSACSPGCPPGPALVRIDSAGEDADVLERALLDARRAATHVPKATPRWPTRRRRAGHAEPRPHLSGRARHHLGFLRVLARARSVLAARPRGACLNRPRRSPSCSTSERPPRGTAPSASRCPPASSIADARKTCARPSRARLAPRLREAIVAPRHRASRSSSEAAANTRMTTVEHAPARRATTRCSCAGSTRARRVDRSQLPASRGLADRARCPEGAARDGFFDCACW